MTISSDADADRRLREIEDRKIEILMEIAQVNRAFDGRISRLREEYAELDSEHYLLKLQRISRGRSRYPAKGMGYHDTE